MTTQHNFFILFQKFIANSKSGKRLKKDGSKIKVQSIANYQHCEKLLLEFVRVKKFDLIVYQLRGSNAREHARLKKYYTNFYRQFTTFMYKEKNCYDNYVGQTIKQIRTFYGWLNQDQAMNTGSYYKSFYVYKEDIPIITLSVKQLRFLTFDISFEKSLPVSLRCCKDMLVFGCMVGLRFSDLASIKGTNIEYRDDKYYLKVRSQKTAIYTLVKLPDQAIHIINKYCKKKQHLSGLQFPD